MNEKDVRDKSRIWNVVPPLKISGDNLTISLAPNGEIKAPYSGDIIIKTLDSEKGQIVCELIPHSNSPQRQAQLSVIVPKADSKSIPHGYSYYFTEQAKSRAYGRVVSNYMYYKRERDLSYLVVIKKNGNERRYHLGSLLDPTSILAEALRAFPTREFLRKDINLSEMPAGLRHGQKVKATLDILTKEGFLSRSEEKYGKRTLDKYKRTGKTAENLRS